MTIVGIEGFQAAAETFGLRLEAPDVAWWRNNHFAMLEGVVDGTRVLVQQGLLGNGIRIYFHAALEPALDLGLGIMLRRSYLASAPPLGEQDVPGTPAFEAAVKVDGLETSRLQAFFTKPMHSALIGWHNARQWERESESKNSLEFWISDESVIVRMRTNALGVGFSPPPMPADELIRDLRATAAFARSVNDAAKHVPPAAALAPYVEHWRAFASSHGLTFSASPLRVSGVFNGVTFAARALYRGADGYGVELITPFARPLPFYVRVSVKAGFLELAKYPDAWSEWASAKYTDDSAFDSAFRVVSVDPAPQNLVLTPHVRRALLELHRTNEHVHMTTDAISVRTKTMVSPEVFAGILRPLSEIEKMIEGSTAR